MFIHMFYLWSEYGCMQCTCLWRPTGPRPILEHLAKV